MRASLRRVWGPGTRRTARTCLVTLTVTAVVSGLTSVAMADPDTAPSQSEVDAAEHATQTKARDVAAVQADLVVANQRVQASQVQAAKAAEAYNGALWKLQQARTEARAAERREAGAHAAVAHQQAVYGEALASSYAMAPQLTAMSAMLDADGPTGVMERYTTLDTAESAMSGQYDDFSAASTLAEVAATQATEARAAAAELEARADAARLAAEAAEAAAAAEAQSVASQRDQLISELATLQDISVSLAGQRQQALEDAAAAAATAAAQQAAEDAAAQAAQEAAEEAAQNPAESDPSDGDPDNQPGDGPSPDPTPEPTPDSEPADPPAPELPAPNPPPTSGGAKAAVAFAKAQLGEPYVWGAAGPNSWDCSGLMLAAWRAGGKYLPHYSVAQYQQSTPISPSDLRAGDLVFWGDSGSSSSIYHVALYVGGGMIVHAPRPGRGVELVSMYYWITPNFYARP